MHLVEQFAYFFKGYRADAYYWEFVVMARKVTVLLISVVAESVQVQSSLLALLMTVSWVLHVYFKPFEDDHLNNVELAALASTTFLFISGQLLYAPALGDGARMLVSVLIIGEVTVFFGMFITDLVRRIWKHRELQKSGDIASLRASARASRASFGVEMSEISAVPSKSIEESAEELGSETA
jgi:hypothetical protein